MTSLTLLSELQTRGVILQPRGDKLAFGPRDKVTPELKAKIVKHKEDLLRLLQPGRTLAEAYRRFWNTPEDASRDTFQSILAEIAILESQCDPGQVIDILETEARRFHSERGRCPHCRQAGPLHHGPDGNEPR